MAIFDKGKPRVIYAKEEADLSQASLNKSLSAAGYDNEGKFVYATMDKVLFSKPVSTIAAVLEAHGFVANLENSLTCLDTFIFGVYGRTSARGGEDGAPWKVNQYVPCVRFELPQRNRVGKILQSFYDEIGKYQAKATGEPNPSWLTHPDAKKLKNLKAEVAELTVFVFPHELIDENGQTFRSLMKKLEHLPAGPELSLAKRA